MHEFSSRMKALGIHFPFLMGPMVGISHAAFRKLIRSYTPARAQPLIFTEMLSTKKIPNESLAKTRELRVFGGERNFVPQLLGNDGALIRASVERLNILSPWGYDINMGCPAKHILQHNYGVALMGDPGYAARIVEFTKEATQKPVSVKLRGQAGAVQSFDALVSFTQSLERAGVDWITLHARPQSQGHKGEANWSLAAAVAKELQVPIVVNGGVQTAGEAVSLVSGGGVDGVMLARAAAARPWIFWQIAEDLGCIEAPQLHEGERAPRTPEQEGREFVRAMIRHLEYLRELFFEPDFIQERIAFHAAMATPWLDFGHAFWKMTTRLDGVEKLEERILDFQSRFEMRMTERITFW
jgi:tRNA-dihydrouridine synthase B